MPRPKKEVAQSPGATNPAPQLFIVPAEPEPGPIVQCEIKVFLLEGECREKRALPQEELEAYVDSIIVKGYTALPNPQRTIVYPPHVIKRVEIYYL